MRPASVWYLSAAQDFCLQAKRATKMAGCCVLSYTPRAILVHADEFPYMHNTKTDSSSSAARAVQTTKDGPSLKLFLKKNSSKPTGRKPFHCYMPMGHLFCVHVYGVQ